MSENLKDILSHLNPDIDQETLLLYLQGKLSAEQQHEVEKQAMNDDFDADALEGLSGIKDKKKIHHLVDQLNADLRKKTEKKKKFRKKLELSVDPWVIVTIIIILLLVVISYIIIFRYMATQG